MVKNKNKSNIRFIFINIKRYYQFSVILTFANGLVLLHTQICISGRFYHISKKHLACFFYYIYVDHLSKLTSLHSFSKLAPEHFLVTCHIFFGILYLACVVVYHLQVYLCNVLVIYLINIVHGFLLLISLDIKC